MAKQIKFGDLVANLTKAFGIPHCPKCERRRLILNEIQKHGVKETIKKMRSVGRSESIKEEKDLQEVIQKLNDCCK